MKISFQNTYYPKYTGTYTNATLSKNDTVNSYAKNSYQISFASTQSSITPLYFVRMSTYKKNLFWNAKMCKATKIISKMMQNGVNIERIIQIYLKQLCIIWMILRRILILQEVSL